MTENVKIHKTKPPMFPASWMRLDHQNQWTCPGMLVISSGIQVITFQKARNCLQHEYYNCWTSQEHVTDPKCHMAYQEPSTREASEMIYILLEIQNKIHPEMCATFLHISCKGSNFRDSSIISLQDKQRVLLYEHSLELTGCKLLSISQTLAFQFLGKCLSTTFHTD